MKQSKTKKTTKSLRRKLTRKDIIKVSIFAVIAFVLGTVALNQLSHYQDKQKFMTLKQDMLALQTEFNKINPGWSYHESCQASGEKFHENEASSCFVEINYSGKINTSSYLDALKAIGGYDLLSSNKINDYGALATQYIVEYGKNSGVGCSLSTSSSKDGTDAAGFGCSDSALDFYFPKTQ